MEIRNSPPWSYHAEENGDEDNKELVSGDSLGKSTKKRNDGLSTENNHVGDCDTESKRSSSPMLSPTFLSDPSKICTEVATTNDCDELELATSESSESDKSWQSHAHVPKTTSLSNGVVARTKKSAHPRETKNQENRYSYLG